MNSNSNRGIIGITAGVWDLFHVGHVLTMEYAKRHCNHLIVCVQVDPSKYREEKEQPIETVFERSVRLQGCRYIDEVLVYETEEDLESILSSMSYDVRFIGSDHQGHSFTGDNIRQDTFHFNPREHNYSSTSLKTRIRQGRKEVKRPVPSAKEFNIEDKDIKEEDLGAGDLLGYKIRKERKKGKR